MDWQTFLSPTVQTTSLALLGILVPAVRGIYRELRTLNGSMLVLKAQLEGHIQLDDSRMQDLRDLVQRKENSK